MCTSRSSEVIFYYKYANSAMWSKNAKKPEKSDFLSLMRATGLEPAHLTAQEPKSCVSANFTTPAY